MDWRLIIKIGVLIVFLLFFSIYYGVFRGMKKITKRLYWYDFISSIIRFLPFFVIYLFLDLALTATEKPTVSLSLIVILFFLIAGMEKDKKEFVPYKINVQIKPDAWRIIGNEGMLDQSIVNGVDFTVLSDFVYCHNKNEFLPSLDFKTPIFKNEKNAARFIISQLALFGTIQFYIYVPGMESKVTGVKVEARLPIEVFYYLKKDLFSGLREKLIKKLLKKHHWARVEDSYEHYLQFEHKYFFVSVDKTL